MMKNAIKPADSVGKIKPINQKGNDYAKKNQDAGKDR